MIETPRLLLRKYRESDLADLYEYLSDPEVVRFEPYKPMTMDEVRKDLIHRCEADDIIAIELKQENKMIGNLCLSPRECYALELGFVLNRQYWNKGYAIESCKAALRHAFSKGIHRIYAQCDPMNASSWHLLECLGFQREAHFRQNIYLWTDETGKPIWKDTYVYAIRSGSYTLNTASEY